MVNIRSEDNGNGAAKLLQILIDNNRANLPASYGKLDNLLDFKKLDTALDHAQNSLTKYVATIATGADPLDIKAEVTADLNRVVKVIAHMTSDQSPSATSAPMVKFNGEVVAYLAAMAQSAPSEAAAKAKGVADPYHLSDTNIILNNVAVFNTAMDAYLDVNSFSRLGKEMGEANGAIADLVTGIKVYSAQEAPASPPPAGSPAPASPPAGSPAPALLALVNIATKEVTDVVDMASGILAKIAPFDVQGQSPASVMLQAIIAAPGIAPSLVQPLGFGWYSDTKIPYPANFAPDTVTLGKTWVDYEASVMTQAYRIDLNSVLGQASSDLFVSLEDCAAGAC